MAPNENPSPLGRLKANLEGLGIERIKRVRRLDEAPDNLNDFLNMIRPQIQRAVNGDPNDPERGTRRCTAIKQLFYDNRSEPITATPVIIHIGVVFIGVSLIFGPMYAGLWLLLIFLEGMKFLAQYFLIIVGLFTAILAVFATAFSGGVLPQINAIVNIITGSLVILKGLHLEEETFPNSYLEFYVILGRKKQVDVKHLDAIYLYGYPWRSRAFRDGWKSSIEQQTQDAKLIEDLRRLLAIICELHWVGNDTTYEMLEKNAKSAIRTVRNADLYVMSKYNLDVDLRHCFSETSALAHYIDNNEGNLDQLINELITPGRNFAAVHQLRVALQTEARQRVEARLQEEARRQEEARLEDEARLQEEATLQEEVRLQEEARRQAEARQREEARVQAEARQREEARRQEEARLQEEARRQAEARLQEEARRQAEARQREEARVQEEARQREDSRSPTLTGLGLPQFPTPQIFREFDERH